MDSLGLSSMNEYIYMSMHRRKHEISSFRDDDMLNDNDNDNNEVS